MNATSVYYFAFASGTARLPSGIAGALSGVIPVFTFVAAAAFLRSERVTTACRQSDFHGTFGGMSDYRAAWVPERSDVDWDEAAAIAVDWIEQECAAQGVRRALLVTHTKSHVGRIIGAFAARHDWTTPQSRHRVDVARGRPVLAYAADTKLIDVAAGYARGSSLCAIESYAHPLAGWARAAGAIDLLTGAAAAPVDESMRKALDGLDFYGNNGWARGFSADQARRKLEVMRDSGQLDRDVILGDMLARGYAHKDVARLGELVDKVAGQ